ncbi:MAG TPA: ABC transporter permease [Acidimicrobiales bacterium]|nr:ABC transporter permease [Acidimicrobiales bacterium]
MTDDAVSAAVLAERSGGGPVDIPSGGGPEARARPSPGRTARRFVTQNLGLVLAYVILAATTGTYLGFFDASRGRLPGAYSVASIVDSSIPLSSAALAQTLVLLTGGIDLSVGGMIDVTNGLAASNFRPDAPNVINWSLAILGVGALGGLVNGLLVVKGRLQPILVTLAMLSILQGVALRILPQPGGSVPSSVTNLLVNPNQPTGLVLIAVMAIGWMAFRRTRFGADVFAMGNDRAAARARGVPVGRTTVAVYVASGMLAAFGGILVAAVATSGDPTQGDVFTLNSIAAAVLGGVSLAGGRGNGVGAIAGAFVLTLIVDVLFFANVNPLFGPFYEGLFLIGAIVLSVAVGSYLRRRSRL